MNILLTGGGTGGHVYPALALAEALHRQGAGARVLFVGSRSGMEAAIVPAAGVPFVGLMVRPPRSRAAMRMFLSLASMGGSLGQALVVVARFKADVMIATGGIAAVPPVMAGAAFGTPVIVLEGNAIPGRTNRFLGRYSRWVAVSSEAAAARWPAGRAVVTGLPVRQDVYTVPREEGLRAFGLDPGRRTVFIVGGSQGAVRLNSAVEEAVVRLAPRRDLQVLHQVGRGWDGQGERAERRGIEGIDYIRVPYLDRIGLAYACADVVVSRCGATALAEITACGLPAILVPYPHAADDHQTHNAAPIVAAGAAVHVADAALSGALLAREIAALFDTPGRLQAMAASARSQGHRDAADRVLALIAGLAHCSAPREVRG
jgi:UDP-N-acetylglucosamine--N-acetylmuramyl-(pentapeptide) pyrophosphoryl-undecaprenol N-acetylglucosamine transferase